MNMAREYREEMALEWPEPPETFRIEVSKTEKPLCPVCRSSCAVRRDGIQYVCTQCGSTFVKS